MKIAALACLALWAPLVAHAARPQVRRLGPADGVSSGEASAVAVGPDGLIWFSSPAGLHRWDGRRVLDADGGVLQEPLLQIVPRSDGSVVVRASRTDRIWVTRDGRAEPLVGPEGEPLVAEQIQVDASDRLVASRRGTLWRLEGDHWEAVRTDPVFADAEGLWVLRNGDFLIGAGPSWWRLPERGDPRMLARVGSLAQQAAEAEDGTLWLTSRLGVVAVLWPDGTERARWDEAHRLTGVATRAGGAWIATTTHLTRATPDGERSVLSQADGVLGGGHIAVDREGSLWLGSFDGLLQLPVPDVLSWSVTDGLTTNLSRTVSLGGGRVWVSNWNWPGWIDPVRRVAGSVPGGKDAKAPLCTDGDGLTWYLGHGPTRGDDSLVGMRGDERVVAWPTQAEFTSVQACETDPDGAVWFTDRDHLLRVRGQGEPLRVVQPFGPELDNHYRALHADGQGDLWISAGAEVCGTPRAEAEAGTPQWRCSRIPEPGARVDSMVRTDAGRLWAGTPGHGVWVQARDESWSPLPGVRNRPSRMLPTVVRSRSGGVWIAGAGTLMRVRDTPENPDGYEVIEDPSGWLGPSFAEIRDLAEADDGTLWLAHSGGVTEVGPGARDPDLAPPPVRLLEARLDGQPAAGASLDLAGPGSVARLEFTAPSYRAPQLLRFRSRLDGGTWGEAVADPVFELHPVPPGRHVLEVTASLDGRRWTEPAARVEVRVPFPWYRRWETWVALVAVVLGGVVVVDRTRQRLALRVERIRTRIAMDLHDEVGAGLGSIGLLASLLRRDLPKQSIDEVADEIRGAASELSDAMRGIVWSLQPASQNLAELAGFLSDRARTILPDLHADGAVHTSVETGAEAVALHLDVLRAAQLIGLEALHNAAKHAQARSVRLVFERADGRWRMVVEDDGRGLGDAVASSVDSGVGLRSQRARAESVDADLEIGERPGGGTRIALTLPRRGRRLA